MTALTLIHPTASNDPVESSSGSPDWSRAGASLLADLSRNELGVHRVDRRRGTSLNDSVYHGWYRSDGRAAVIVEDRPGNYRPLPHLLRHSPAGMAWGYNGNGSRDLSRSLLADALGGLAICHACAGPIVCLNTSRPQHLASDPSAATAAKWRTPACPNHCDAGILPLPYLRFTEQVVATRLRYGKAWSMRRIDVLRWLANPQPPAPPGFTSPEPAPQSKARTCSRRTRPARSRSSGRRR
jgi:hypothetical protein